MSITNQLHSELLGMLPQQHHPAARQIASLAAAVVERRLYSQDASTDILPAPELKPALRTLVGRQIDIGAALISFGSDNSFGDISIGDVILGDKINVNVTLPHQSPRHDPAPTRPRKVEALIGRESELSYFSNRLTIDHMAVVVGMTGVGKTDFVSYLARKVAEEKNICWYELRRGGSFEALLEELAEFLAWRGDWSLHEQLESAFRHAGAKRDPGLLVNYLERALRGKGYLICLDDFHEGMVDENIVLVADRLYRLAADKELDLIISSQRCPPFVQKTDFPLLQGLDEAALGQLLTSRGHSATLARALWNATEGTAVYVTATLKLLDGADDPEEVIAGLDPDNFDTLFDRVYRQLRPEQQRVMQAVALFRGYPGTRDAVEAVLDTDQQKHILDDLVGCHLLTMSKGGDQKVYDQHQLWRKFCYGLLGEMERHQLHLRAANYYNGERLARRDAAQLPKLSAVRHYIWAEEYERAVVPATATVWTTILRGGATELERLLDVLAAQKHDLTAEALGSILLARGRCSWARGAVKHAQESYQQAYAVLHAIEGSPLAVRLKAEACARLGRALQFSFPEQALSWVAKGFEAIGTNTLPDIEANLHVTQGSALVTRARYDQALNALERGLALLPSKPGELRVDALINRSAALFQIDVKRAATVAREGLLVCDGLREEQGVDDGVRRIALLTNLAVATFADGEWTMAREAFAKASKLAETWGSKAQQLRLKQNLGVIAIDMGDDELAERTLGEVCSAATNDELHQFSVACLSGLADLRLRRAPCPDTTEYREVNQFITEAEALIAATNTGSDRLSEMARYRAELLLLCSEYKKALTLAEQAVAIAVEHLDTNLEGQAWRVVALARVGLKHRAKAREAFERSMALLVEDDYQLARTRASWGKTLQSNGSVAKGAELLAQARTTFADLGAQRDLAQLELP